MKILQKCLFENYTVIHLNQNGLLIYCCLYFSIILGLGLIYILIYIYLTWGCFKKRASDILLRNNTLLDSLLLTVNICIIIIIFFYIDYEQNHKLNIYLCSMIAVIFFSIYCISHKYIFTLNKYKITFKLTVATLNFISYSWETAATLFMLIITAKLGKKFSISILLLSLIIYNLYNYELYNTIYNIFVNNSIYINMMWGIVLFMLFLEIISYISETLIPKIIDILYIIIVGITMIKFIINNFIMAIINSPEVMACFPYLGMFLNLDITVRRIDRNSFLQWDRNLKIEDILIDLNNKINAKLTAKSLYYMIGFRIIFLLVRWYILGFSAVYINIIYYVMYVLIIIYGIYDSKNEQFKYVSALNNIVVICIKISLIKAFFEVGFLSIPLLINIHTYLFSTILLQPPEGTLVIGFPENVVAQPEYVPTPDNKAHIYDMWFIRCIYSGCMQNFYAKYAGEESEQFIKSIKLIESNAKYNKVDIGRSVYTEYYHSGHRAMKINSPFWDGIKPRPICDLKLQPDWHPGFKNIEQFGLFPAYKNIIKPSPNELITCINESDYDKLYEYRNVMKSYFLSQVNDLRDEWIKLFIFKQGIDMKLNNNFPTNLPLLNRETIIRLIQNPIKIHYSYKDTQGHMAFTYMNAISDYKNHILNTLVPILNEEFGKWESIKLVWSLSMDDAELLIAVDKYSRDISFDRFVEETKFRFGTNPKTKNNINLFTSFADQVSTPHIQDPLNFFSGSKSWVKHISTDQLISFWNGLVANGILEPDWLIGNEIRTSDFNRDTKISFVMAYLDGHTNPDFDHHPETKVLSNMFSGNPNLGLYENMYKGKEKKGIFTDYTRFNNPKIQIKVAPYIHGMKIYNSITSQMIEKSSPARKSTDIGLDAPHVRFSKYNF